MSKTVTLNVGMDIAATEALSAQVIREILVANGLLLGREAVVQSDTEKTLVIDVMPGLDITNPGRMHAAIYLSAKDLRQECIAVWNEQAQIGGLVGPHAAKWGNFNPAFFFAHDGQRLAQPVTTQE